MSSLQMETGASGIGNAEEGAMPGKRFFDVIASGVLLILCLPLLALTALAVRMSLGRPLMFRQERAGSAMRAFHISKFRTMTEERDASGMLLPDAERQTRLTAFMRRIRVDELPQLLAVLRGDMSFVGPRPLPLAAVRAFGEFGRLRCSVRPGMTGWAQVNGNTRLTGEQKMALDIWYVDHRSLVVDMMIVAMTIRTIVFGEVVNFRNLKAAELHLQQRAAAFHAPRPGD